jgi:hypothetical protein
LEGAHLVAEYRVKKLVLIAFALLFLFAATCYIFYVPPRKTGYLGVTYSWSQTNVGGTVTHILDIHNGPYRVQVSTGTETRNGQFASYNMSGVTTLEPGENATISLTQLPASSPQARTMASFQKVYTPPWLGRAQWFLDAYLLKRAVVERVYPPPMQ